MQKEVERPRNIRTSLIAMFALRRMLEGPVYGYSLAAEISEKTGESWSPGPGTIYPALHHLVEKNYAKTRTEEGRRVYYITRQGKAKLESFRRKMARTRGRFQDAGRLWMEIMDDSELREFIVHRLKTDIKLFTLITEGRLGHLSVKERKLLTKEVATELKNLIPYRGE
ncbi:MAG: PadR family transcriptional regulator [Thermoplasmata archaeon]|nr:PadR family transcriptional regulator [Candidatus Sysuiplasma acidicola]MBX8645954.1 PadR family transcriptional regulator [Candidatus Sysuiplasma acidicola]MDH2906008.1 PadR family transcriptional regulator [Methanomassiliicoccales archaeon]